ncbi:MAG: iron chaperone [Frankiaceae bacterium]
MSAAEVDAYLDRLDEPKRSTLSQLRHDILGAVPDAEQCVSYAVPVFKVAGKTIAGFAAFKDHLSYLPHSGSVFPELARAGRLREVIWSLTVSRRPAAAGPLGQEAHRRAAAAGLLSRPQRSRASAR